MALGFITGMMIVFLLVAVISLFIAFVSFLEDDTDIVPWALCIMCFCAAIGGWGIVSRKDLVERISTKAKIEVETTTTIEEIIKEEKRWEDEKW